MNIGENIKNLRLAKNITQEKLAEYLNISAPAISKWERGETLPDITMVIPLASYFGISSDKLLGFDEALNKITMQKQLDEYHQLSSVCKWDESTAIITELRTNYPHDFQIALVYMYHFIGGRADNSQAVLQQHAAEFIPLCERILNECTVNTIRHNTSYILAKMHKACGNYEKAISSLDGFPTWFDTKDQMLEQLHDKDTEEFRYWVNMNMFELLAFAFNKAGKSIWYTNESMESRINATHQLVTAIEGYINASEYAPAHAFIAAIYHEGGKVLNIERQYDKAMEFYEAFLANLQKFKTFYCSGKAVASMPDKVMSDITARYGDYLHNTIEWMKNTPFLEELRKNKDFFAMVEGLV